MELAVGFNLPRRRKNDVIFEPEHPQWIRSSEGCWRALVGY
jgi:hypothetical protein